MICMECGAELRYTDDAIDEVVLGVSTHVDGIPHWQCDECGDYVLDIAVADELGEAQISQVCVAKGLLTPRDIRETRLSLGMTRAEFEKALGVPASTVSMLESGVMFPTVEDCRLIRSYASSSVTTKTVTG